jgi:hypothetical protein
MGPYPIEIIIPEPSQVVHSIFIYKGVEFQIFDPAIGEFEIYQCLHAHFAAHPEAWDAIVVEFTIEKKPQSELPYE